MFNKSLLLKIYEAASMQRWNDQVRVVELTELDKQAHKMVIAYVLGRYEQGLSGKKFDWVELIEAGLFEFLQRIVLTDLKPPLFHRIKEDKEKYIQLNDWVYAKIEPVISFLGQEFCRRFKNYLTETERSPARRIISAAHFYATKWEFDIIERTSPRGHLINEIRKDLWTKQKRYKNLKCMQALNRSGRLKDFINICGQLRFQIRWSHLYRVPKTSVLGHMLVVAMLSYLFSLRIKASPQICINNYFTGLFHDLPEALTRDIINPVKRSVEGLDKLIKDYERQEMQRKIYTLLPQGWHQEMKMFTENEFSDIKGDSGDIRHGGLVKAVDDLAAFIEADLALKNGAQAQDLTDARQGLKDKYRSNIIKGVDFSRILNSFG